jgi:hypothetical protein
MIQLHVSHAFLVADKRAGERRAGGCVPDV